MSTKNTDFRYGVVAMAFHWVIAGLIISNVVLGVYFVTILDGRDAMRPAVVGLHESIGLVILILSLLRIGWRLINPVPQLPVDFGRAKRLLAHGTHYALYALMIFVPVLGWVLASIPSGPLTVFGIIPWPKILDIAVLSPAAKAMAGGIIAPMHIILAFTLFGLAVGHLCAALFYHCAMRRDQILQRMVPGTDVDPRFAFAANENRFVPSVDKIKRPETV